MQQRYPLKEEIASSILHGFGAVLSVAGLTALVIYASRYGSAKHIVGAAVFGAALVCLYTSSTLYHGLRSARLKRIFRVIDHSCIYLLIAGTYTPFTLVTLEGPVGWSLFGIVWALATVGIVFQIFFVHRFKLLATLAYIGMGWLVIFAIKPLIDTMPAGGLVLVTAGGLAYTLGAVFYLLKKMPFNHAVWHVFVLAGSTCHYFAVMRYVVPPVT
ncbi:MAG TPA: hemolysin III family protein [Syntrophales bacterium]|nr:hemolysin III family protein [Syntrophales bacterium]HOX95072.1 hemolysin III family protein [Syntrophales bacterium]HPI55767.1 hemolysin III family protein [Syntrophales bacterium]HPN23741.1 hemolysin III family protein [Syntrophales bacterium]HQM27733.1 hemolysin III family protein [Syntrophales bacterium]